jgi:hypothetical protein
MISQEVGILSTVNVVNCSRNHLAASMPNLLMVMHKIFPRLSEGEYADSICHSQ